MEIDWNSLFTGFFGMVRVKIAYKDRSKVPGKRMFEMMNKLFLIQFKVEGASNMGDGSSGDDGGDNDDQGFEDDNVIEEVDPEDDNFGKKPSVENLSGGSKSGGQNSRKLSERIAWSLTIPQVQIYLRGSIIWLGFIHLRF
jgi:hypothetical protein